MGPGGSLEVCCHAGKCCQTGLGRVSGEEALEDSPC